MKKILTKLLVLALSVVLLCGTLTGCKDEKWKGTSLTNPGTIDSVYKFVAVSQNYTYFINGLGSASNDNNMGKPVKGALAVTDGSKTEIAVPKLFVASDYNAGLFIDDGYVYYGTPNTEKNASGEIASDELVFTRSKLVDAEKTETFFAIQDLSVQYRFVKSGDVVYIVYYDASESAIKEYNTSNKEVKTIAKIDAKTSGMESLENFVFLNDGSADVIFTNVVYSEAYSESKENDTDSYQRASENYNVVYAYKAGSEPVKIFDGACDVATPVDDTTYAITKVQDGLVYYTKKVIHEATATTYIATVSEFVNKTEGAKVVNESYITDTGLVVDTQNVYFVENNKLYKSTLVANDSTTKTVVAIISTINKMLFIDGDYLYYINTSNFIARLNLADSDAVEERVSEGAVATTWYAPEIVTLGGKKHIAYLDNSATGASYVKTVLIDGVAWNEKNFVDADDDGEYDKGEVKFLDGQKFLAKITDADMGSIMNAKINAISNDFKNSAIQFERKEENGKVTLTFDKLTEVKAEYDALSDKVKENVSDEAKEKLTTYENAVKLANLYVQLEDVIKYTDLTADKKVELKDLYKNIKGQIESLKTTEVDAVIETNLKFYFQEAGNLFKD